MFYNDEGLLLELDLESRITKIIYEKFTDPVTKESFSISGYEGKLFISLFPEELTGKALSFLAEIRTKSAAFGWEFYLKDSKRNNTVFFGGGIINGAITIMGSFVKADFSNFFTGMMMINNEQVERIRILEKEKHDKTSPDMKSLFEELSRLNNELVNYQREMAKKNVEFSELNRIKNQFLGMVVHDLRNPLSNILMLSDFIKAEDEGLGENQLELVTLINSSATAMLSLVNELLDVSAIESGEIKLNREDADITILIKKIVDLNANHAARKDIKLHLKTIDNVERIFVDVNKIEQVMSNLLTNAIKYSYPGTNVYVTMEIVNDFITISVKDEGQGIHETELKNLFKPFQKTSAKTTGGETSTGLGLFIVKRIIEQHGGSIKVESKIGEGSTFSFSLKIKKEK